MKTTPVLLVLACTVAVAYGIVCLPNFCQRNKCVEPKCLPSQVYRENGTFCGCCPICVSLLEENERCFSIVGVPPKTYCRPPLRCTDGACKKKEAVE